MPENFITRREYEAEKEARKWASGSRQMVISLLISVWAFLIAFIKLK
jgi:hypothetical protein